MRTSTELTIEHMAGRLERVERSCRRWKLLNLTMATIFFSILMMGGRRADDPQGTVEAERFVLKDKNGRLRGEWTTFADEKSDVETGLRLLDRDGNARIQLWVLGGEGKHADTPLITLHHSDKISRLALMVPYYGRGIILISDKDKRTLVDLPKDLVDRQQNPPAR